MNIVEKAIKNNEIKFLLEGTNGYKLENDSWASISAPIDWTRVVPLIYKQYEKSFDANIEKMFVKAIVDMLNGNAEEVYCGVAVLYFQILMEESSRAPFCVDRESLIKIASQTIRENEEQLKSIKKWGGQSSENGLWDEIRRFEIWNNYLKTESIRFFATFVKNIETRIRYRLSSYPGRSG